MRLLDTSTFELRSDSQEFFKSQGYAILSHRWVGAEITFDEIAQHGASLRATGEKRIKSPQLDKIRGACQMAYRQGIQWMWIDNCCINKSSATEEAESINSMFKWYRDARLCITYLSDVDSRAPSGVPSSKEATNVLQSIDGDRPSQWFSRGWTLQELLAPRDMYFYDLNWDFIGTKTSLAPEIQRITGIDIEYLTGARHFRKACIATKMSWQAGRTTTRVEDIAYSMLGLFGIMMAPQYGEGQRAYMRLQQQLLSTTPDESLFAWKMPEPNAGDRYDIEQSTETTWGSNEWGLLAASPDWFKGCGNVTIEGGPPIERPSRTFQMNRQSLQIPVMPLEQFNKYKLILLLSPLTLIGAIPIFFYIARKVRRDAIKGVPFVLNCWTRDGSGASAAVCVRLSILPETAKMYTGSTGYKFKRIECSELELSYKYAQQGAEGEAEVLQPELRLGD